MHIATLLVVGMPTSATLFGFVLLARRNLVRQERAALALDEAVSVGAHIPVSLHPVVDPNACICSGACIAACPEGDVLGIVMGTARLVNANRCIGHGECMDACPVDAIRLV